MTPKVIIKLPKKLPKRKINEIINIGLIGAGDFARGTILPILKKIKGINLKGVASTTGHKGIYVAKKFGFEYHSTDYRKILKDPDIDAVIIATRHQTHAKMVVESLKHGKNVFVEKPLAVTIHELKEIVKTYRNNPNTVMVGFNRRFAPHTIIAKSFIRDYGNDPLVIDIRVNTGHIPRESWVHDIKEGTRIVGEICHFVDLAYFFAESKPIRVYAENIAETEKYLPDDNVQVNIKFKDGSIAHITYVSSGDKSLGRERVEVYGNGGVAVIDNFRKLILSRDGKRKTQKKFSVDRGHYNQFLAFINALKGKATIDFESYLISSLATIKILDSLQHSSPKKIELNEIF